MQACRAYAVLGVILSHISGLEERYFHSNHCRLFRAGNIGVDVFFIVSGLVISLVTTGKFRVIRNALTFLYHRVARIYPVFWFYFMIALAIFLYKPSLVNALAGHKPHLLRAFLLIPSESPNLVVQSWSLSYEVAFYLVFGVAMLLLLEKWLPYFLGAWALVIFLVGAIHIHPPPVIALLSSAYDLEFIVGCCLFLLYRRVSSNSFRGRLAVLMAVLCFLGVTLWCVVENAGSIARIDERPWLRIALWTPPAALFVWGAIELEGHSRWFDHPWIDAIGDWSYSLYLSHIIVIATIGRPLAAILRHLPGGFILAYIIIIPCVLGLGYLSFRFLEQPLMKFFYKRTPKREHATV
ncbi:acyltransferase family protein [Silvibacterium acidisoli]|uniref:acyltransferase family protein n=1 Tax=Acidobacteriaceae bacterium ZG23-2 TaxID=2883246 RepID=UPI00406C89C8